jgi:hypothetical protein
MYSSNAVSAFKTLQIKKILGNHKAFILTLRVLFLSPTELENQQNG